MKMSLTMSQMKPSDKTTVFVSVGEKIILQMIEELKKVVKRVCSKKQC